MQMQKVLCKGYAPDCVRKAILCKKIQFFLRARIPNLVDVLFFHSQLLSAQNRKVNFLQRQPLYFYGADEVEERSDGKNVVVNSPRDFGNLAQPQPLCLDFVLVPAQPQVRADALRPLLQIRQIKLVAVVSAN